MENRHASNSWRIERWIAFVLFLLFFLPFVARGEEILLTGSFHHGEVRQRSSDDWLALTETPEAMNLRQRVRDGKECVHRHTRRSASAAGIPSNRP
jgi:hypothetical protein